MKYLIGKHKPSFLPNLMHLQFNMLCKRIERKCRKRNITRNEAGPNQVCVPLEVFFSR